MKATNYGKEELIGALYVKYAAEAKQFFNACLHDVMAAEDLTQDLFLKLFSIDIITDATAKGLIMTMARRMVVDHTRRKKLNKTFMQYYYDFHSATTSNINAIDMLGTYEQGCLKSMTKRRAQIYLLYFHDGKSTAEISRLLNIEKRTVESHIYNSRKTMLQHLRSVV